MFNDRGELLYRMITYPAFARSGAEASDAAESPQLLLPPLCLVS